MISLISYGENHAEFTVRIAKVTVQNRHGGDWINYAYTHTSMRADFGQTSSDRNNDTIRKMHSLDDGSQHATGVHKVSMLIAYGVYL